MSVTSPAAPGRLGEAASPQDLEAYLTQLRAWIEGRKRELDAIDAESLAKGPASHTASDVALSMALWQSIVTRANRLGELWNGGRVGAAERLDMTSVIWGRLDDTRVSSSPMNASLPEATSLSDALAASLRTRLAMSPDADAVQHRITQLGAQLERLRSQALLEPDSSRNDVQAQVETLAARLESARDSASRGGDVLGIVGPLELTAATLERDLIVGGERRRRLASQRQALATRLSELAAQEAHVRDLASRAGSAVSPAPKYAVPDVSQLGPLPDDEQEWKAFGDRMAKVGQALTFVGQANAAALDELQSLRDRFANVMESVSGAVVTHTRETLANEPVTIAVAAPLVAAVEAMAQREANHEV